MMLLATLLGIGMLFVVLYLLMLDIADKL